MKRIIFLIMFILCLGNLSAQSTNQSKANLGELLSIEEIYFSDKAINLAYKAVVSHPTHQIASLSFRFHFITLGSGVSFISPAFNSGDNFYGPDYTYITTSNNESVAKDWSLENPGFSHVPIMLELATSSYRNKFSFSISGVYLYPIKELVYKPNFDILGMPDMDDPRNVALQEERIKRSPSYLLITPKVKYFFGDSIFSELGVSFRTGSGNIDPAHDELYIRPYLSLGYSFNFINNQKVIENYVSIADIYFSKKQYNRALDYYKKAGKEAENIYRVTMAQADNLIAEANNISGYAKKASKFLAAANLYEKVNNNNKKIESLISAAHCYMDAGSMEVTLVTGEAMRDEPSGTNVASSTTAVSYYKKAADIFRRLGDEDKEKEALAKIEQAKNPEKMIKALKMLQDAVPEKTQ